MNELLLYTGGALTILWGISHLFPTRQVVRGFGSITQILTMEWIAEAILLIFTGALVVFTTARFGADGAAPETTFAASAIMLLTLAAISAATGGRVDFIMYRPCAPHLHALGGAHPRRGIPLDPSRYPTALPNRDSPWAAQPLRHRARQGAFSLGGAVTKVGTMATQRSSLLPRMSRTRGTSTSSPPRPRSTDID